MNEPLTFDFINGEVRGPTVFQSTPVPPAQSHSVTSVNAASAIAEHAPKMRERVYAEICKWPGTDQELAHRLELSENSVRPRRVELQRQGKVKAVSKRNTLSGRQATVWGAS